MARYRKKPVVIEAVQWTGDLVEMMKGMLDWPAGPVQTDLIPAVGPELYVRTSEGMMRADVGDWIIRGVEGELYPCKPSVFEKTYEAVDG